MLRKYVNTVFDFVKIMTRKNNALKTLNFLNIKEGINVFVIQFKCHTSSLILKAKV